MSFLSPQAITFPVSQALTALTGQQSPNIVSSKVTTQNSSPAAPVCPVTPCPACPACPTCTLANLSSGTMWLLLLIYVVFFISGYYLGQWQAKNNSARFAGPAGSGSLYP